MWARRTESGRAPTWTWLGEIVGFDREGSCVMGAGRQTWAGPAERSAALRVNDDQTAAGRSAASGDGWPERHRAMQPGNRHAIGSGQWRRPRVRQHQRHCRSIDQSAGKVLVHQRVGTFGVRMIAMRSAVIGRRRHGGPMLHGEQIAAQPRPRPRHHPEQHQHQQAGAQGTGEGAEWSEHWRRGGEGDPRPERVGTGFNALDGWHRPRAAIITHAATVPILAACIGLVPGAPTGADAVHTSAYRPRSAPVI